MLELYCPEFCWSYIAKNRYFYPDGERCTANSMALKQDQANLSFRCDYYYWAESGFGLKRDALTQGLYPQWQKGSLDSAA